MNLVNVIGAGRWGTFLAWHLVKYKQQKNVKLFGIAELEAFQRLKRERKNDFLELPDEIEPTSDMKAVLDAKYIIISIEAQQLKSLALEIDTYDIKEKTFILAMKGLDVESKKRLSEVMLTHVKQPINVAVLLGPGHVQDYLRGCHNCAVVDSNVEAVRRDVAHLLRSSIMRIYYGTDLIGNEIGGAFKNVIGIVAGMLDGLGWQSLKGALMARAVVEAGRFIVDQGGHRSCASGLSFLGDFEATLFSKYSNNRLFGELFVAGKHIEAQKNCEGYHTLKAIYELGQVRRVELPVVNTLFGIVYDGKPIKESLENLFGTDLQDEFE